MRVLVSIASGSNNTERNILRSFYDGIEKFYFQYFKCSDHKTLKKVHGIDLRLSYDPEIEKCDIAVQFGTVKERSNEHHITKQSIRKNAKTVIFVETPLLGRLINKKNDYTFYRVGVDGFLNNAGVFYQEETLDRNRIQLLKNSGLHIKDFTGWKNHQVGSILILLQLPGDASLRGQSLSEWFLETVDKVRMNTEREIIVRFHPAMSEKGRSEFFSEIRDLFFKNYKNIIWSDGIEFSLEDDFKRSGICISYTSGSSIDAILYGIPVIAMDEGNLAYPISSRRIEDISNPKMVSEDEVQKWMLSLANSQWNEQEMLNGTVWSNIYPIIIEKLKNDSNNVS